MEFNDFSVSGRVIDASGNPISGVKVTLQEKGQTLLVTTQSTGTYEFKNLGMGVKNLTYFHNSYKTETRSVEARYYYKEKVADVVLERIPGPNPLEALVESMVFVKGGTFQMGETYGSLDPLHSVTLSNFYIGKYEVTQAQWKAVMGENPSYFTGDDNLPVEQVSWDEIQEFIEKLNQLTGKTYRLPTEAEWQYAARGGNQSRGYKYAGSNAIEEVAWYDQNSDYKTHPVGQKQPNELGLYDMSGNVCEWCWDWYGRYDSSAQTNPTGPSSGTYRVHRGGSWWNGGDTEYCRVAYRCWSDPSSRYDVLGFRLVEGELPQQEDPDPEVDPLEALAESMVFVEGGTFQMGATSEQESDAYDGERPVHAVTLNDFYIGKYEVTQAQWKAVMGENPSWFTGDENLPVERVSWEDVQEFIQKLNAKTGKTYRLPTEAEWEYAARGGNQSQGYKYAGSNTLEELAWYDGNSNLQTHPVGKKQPNELGLYDMSGNVYEWCQDCYGAYSSSSQTNPTGPAGGLQRVLRGSSWGDSARSCRVSHRHCDYPSNRYEYYGFRLVEGELPPQEDPEVDPLEALAESMVFVEGGTFQMGATSEQGSDANDREKPVHSVTLSDFYMGKYEVTQAQWKAVMGENPSSFTGDDNLPVEQVSWEDVQEFIQKLNALTGKTYRLPTEAEWEYAARGGNQSQGYKYAGSNSIDMVAWYDANSDHKTHPVGQKQPNELGLYDMNGNVYEWCQDWYGSYDSSAQTNPTGPSSGASRVLRGGSCYTIAEACRVASRHDLFPSYGNIHYGFRLVEGELPPQEDPEVDPLEALAESMVFVEGGTFQMGATDEQGADAFANEKPVHEVTLSDFYIGKCEVTQAQWTAVMGNNPSYFKGDNLPVEQVSWDDIQEFIQKLNQLTGKTYRLPTEAEWEYAARGGNQSQGYKYAGSNTIEEVAWYSGNSNEKTHPVGQLQPNELGLYDMSGNVYEWCQDWYGGYVSSSKTNPTGPASGSSRVLRGGRWDSSARYCRVAYRSDYYSSYRGGNLGFRLVEGEMPPQEDLKALAESMIFVEGGTFQMGGTDEQGAGAFANEKPVHEVTLSDFYIGKYEVTQAQWRAVMGNTPSSFKGDNLPVGNVSWDAIQEFIQKLNELTGKKYRLPTEAEWEYAARGGKKSKGYKYAGSNTLEEVAWYSGNSNKEAHLVGQKQPNELGLYDMSGNVYEWCQDWYGEYTSFTQTNPTGPGSGEYRVHRGGSYSYSAGCCRVSFREDLDPSIQHDNGGFRLVEGELPPTGSEEEGGEEGPLDVQWTRVTGTEIGDNAWELNFEGTANGETVRIEYAGFWQMGDYTIGRLNEGVYNVTDSDFTGNIVYASSVYVTVPGAPASDLVSGTVTVSWVEGGYEFVFDVATISGSTLKATYSGPVTGMQDPNTIGGGEEGGVLNVNFTSASASRKLKLQATYEGDISGMIVPK